MEHIIDANGKTLGRVAAEAAKLLLGKDRGEPKHKVAARKVKIINAAKVLMTTKKLKQTTKAHYSGFPGGLRYETWQQIVAKKGFAELLRQAVAGMLPRNKLKKLRMKNLEIKE